MAIKDFNMAVAELARVTGTLSIEPAGPKVQESGG
jgi:hypothetical protein